MDTSISSIASLLETHSTPSSSIGKKDNRKTTLSSQEQKKLLMNEHQEEQQHHKTKDIWSEDEIQDTDATLDPRPIPQ